MPIRLPVLHTTRRLLRMAAAIYKLCMRWICCCALFLAGCTLQAPTTLDPTRDPPAQTTPTRPATATSVPTTASALTPSLTPAAPGASPAPASPSLPIEEAPLASTTGPFLTALTTVNLREGPGTGYQIVNQMAANETASIQGRTEAGDWWLIAEPATGRPLWVTGEPSLTAVHDVANVPIISTAARSDVPALPLVHELAVAAHALAFSPDATSLVLAAMVPTTTHPAGFTVQVQSYATAGWTLRWQATVDDFVTTLAFSPDGHFVAAADAAGAVNVWRTAGGQSLYRLAYEAMAVGSAFSADSFLLASGSLSGKTVVNQSANGEIVGEYVNALPVSALAVSPDGPWLAVMTAGSWGPVELAVWDIFTHERRTLLRFEGLPNQSDVAFSPDTQWLAASVEPNGPVRVWQTRIWPEVAQLDVGGAHILHVAFSPDNARLAALGLAQLPQGRLWLWRVPDWTPVAQIDIGDVPLAMAFAPDGRTLATVMGQGNLPTPPLYEGRLWDTSSGQLLGRMPHTLQVQSVAFSPDGAWVATGASDRTTRIWALAPAPISASLPAGNMR